MIEEGAGRKFPRPASFKDAAVNRGLGVPIGVAVVTVCAVCPLCCAVAAGKAVSRVPAK